MAKHKVKQGECISSIAQDYGFFWETLWNLPENAELKQKRKNPNILSPDDQVFVPDKREKTENGATEQLHRFRRKGEPARARMVFMQGNQPLSRERYVLEIDGKLTKGVLGPDGEVEIGIPGNAQSGRILIGPEQDEYPIQLGAVDPIDTMKGVQQRLNNLGYDCGEVDGVLGESRTSS
jgi:hypothetical protein